MNYRHAFHAGNHADVLKHATFARAIWHLNKKSKPYAVLDAHSGPGLYDVRSVEAVKTGEWQSGVAKLAKVFSDPVEDALRPYREALVKTEKSYGASFYPGSPMIARHLIRPSDRLILNELHAGEAEIASQIFGGDVERHNRSALQSVKALLPFKERRGIVLYDPPYEVDDETDVAVKAVAEGLKRFASGVFMIWYPVKGKDFAEKFVKAFAALKVPDMLQAQLQIKESFEGGGLAGSGLIIINPPYGLYDDLAVVMPALAERLGIGKWGRHTLKWLTPPS